MPGRRGFWQVFALVLLGHGAVLTQLTPGPPPPRGQAGLPVQVLYVRAMQPPAAEAVPPALAAPPPISLTATAPAPEPAQPSLAPGPKPGEQAPLPRIDATAGRGAEPVAVAAAPVSAAASAAAAADAPYFPRGQLTVAPRLLTPVQVPFPEEVSGIVDLKVRISLFIDEQGAVRRIRIDTPNVHPSFERTVREAFAAARFAPGQLEAAAVRSQIRMEVEFAAAGRPRR